jgi:hypothetical protein
MEFFRSRPGHLIEDGLGLPAESSAHYDLRTK